jgi:hypothetical protein
MQQSATTNNSQHNFRHRKFAIRTPIPPAPLPKPDPKKDEPGETGGQAIRPPIPPAVKKPVKPVPGAS